MKVNLPAKNPLGIRICSPTSVRKKIKAKYVPRDPKGAEEMMLTLERPQTGPYSFAEYGKGDLIEQFGGSDVGIEHSWLTGDVIRLAWTIRQSGENDAMPILADALEEAGCTNTALLTSLRDKKTEGWVTKILACCPQAYVIVAAKPGFSRSGESWKVWEQIVVVRLASSDDHNAVAKQRKAHEAETKRVMDQMMSS